MEAREQNSATKGKGKKSRRDGAAKPGVEERAQAGSGTLGFRIGWLSPVRAMQADCAALTGLLYSSSPTQGSHRFAAFALGFAASRFQRFNPFSFTRMALRAGFSAQMRYSITIITI
jgi:hypothetical protein